ncbi:NAD(P)-binding domain-containing protein [Chondrinema litorale]|uniref:NAD(P)-binding domain-containing protein n=1 Tax=Chondrinema litorale TaxID=2994555 RepID=UPI002542C867|nr:NAD(P)-binding domain-containing protein [Chondrinema litorale]UZR98268.1 NAD(P)-binding domain-containing protein [Chondrinema litorale]
MKINKSTEVLVIGAGPLGVECSVNLKINGIDHMLVDAGCLGNTILKWDNNTHFLSTPDRLEIAEIPFQSVDQKSPTGEAYLSYLRNVVEIFDLPLFTYHKVTEVKREGSNGFAVKLSHKNAIFQISTKKIILASGGMNELSNMGIPGEEYSFVHSNENINHKYFRKKVLIVGDGNSALEKAIRAFRMGADVSLLIQQEKLDAEKVRFEYLRECRLLIEKEKIRLISKAQIEKIDENGNCFFKIMGITYDDNFDFIIKCVGYNFNEALLKEAGVELDEDKVPYYDKETMETNIPGIYLAGTVAGGLRDMEKLFIGTCHSHVEKIIHHLDDSSKTKTGSPANRKYSFKYEDVQFPPSEV